MKKALLFLLLFVAASAMSQTHRIGINGGITTIASYDGFPPFGMCSPYDAKGAYVAYLNYSNTFRNKGV